MTKARHSLLLALAYLSITRSASAGPVDPYDAAMARSAEAEARGDMAAAAKPLEETIPLYPQDYQIALRLGLVYHRAGRFVDAERVYRTALSLAAQSLDVRLGLGWALVRQDRCDDAREVLAPVLDAQDPRAREAMDACIPGGRRAASPGAASAWPVDPYDAAMARSAEAEARGDMAAAAKPLEETIPLYPQDYQIALRLGLVYHRAGRFVDAERVYRTALSLAAQSPDARLGLGWALVRQARCGDAREVLAPMLDAQDPPAKEAMNACVASQPSISVYAAYNPYFFPNNTYKKSGLGVFVSAGGYAANGFVLQAAFRHVAITAVANSGASDFTQQEVYARAGYSVPRGAILAQGAVVIDGSGTFGTSKHVGLWARWSPAGDLLLDASLSVYDDLTLGRLAPSWSIPVAGPLRLAPGVAFQTTGDEFKATGSLTASLDWPSLSVWAGGKYGVEIRPTYLSQFAVYDIAEQVLWGAWAGVRAKLHSLLSLQATYAFDRVRSTDTTPIKSYSHAIMAGPLLTF